MLKNSLPGKHAQNNRDSREGQVLRFVREARKFSLKDVAARLNMKSLDIDHFENGRKFYTNEDIEKFLICYDFSQENFKGIMELKVLNKQLVNHFLMKI